MNWLVMIGRAATRTLTGAAALLIFSNALADSAHAAQPVSAQPQSSSSCRFTDGPRAGQTQSNPDMADVQPIPVGAPCTDGYGSIGVGVPDPFAPPVMVAAPVPAAAAPIRPARGLSSTCQFDNGPRTGEIQSYAGVTGIQPFPVGSRCTDGQGSSGVAIPDPSVQLAAPVMPPPPPVAPPQLAPPPVEISAAIPPPPPPLDRRASAEDAVIAGAAVGAPTGGLPGAVWADPKNSGYVTGYTYKGRYHAGAPRGSTIRPAVLAGGVGGPVVPVAPAMVVPTAISIPGSAAIGASVGGFDGATWADLNNDRVVDGYVFSGHYYPGVPPGYVPDAAPPPPPPPPSEPESIVRMGERG